MRHGTSFLYLVQERKCDETEINREFNDTIQCGICLRMFWRKQQILAWPKNEMLGKNEIPMSPM